MKRYDLNLLQTLDVLISEKSVSKAATRLGIGQPAMSAALARLRELFGDPILVRKGSGMQTTARANELAEPLRTTLAQLSALIQTPRSFNPADAGGTLKLSGGDYVGMTILPQLATRLADEAPRVDLRFRYLEKDRALEFLENDTLDFALMVVESLPTRYDSIALLDEGFTGAARQGHPLLKGVIDLRSFASFGHLLVTERGDDRGRIDEVLSGAGLTRRVVVTVPSAALVAAVLCKTDLITAVPTRVADRISKSDGITLFQPPLDLGRWTMRLVWSRRRTHEPALSWFRHLLADIALTV